MKKPYLIAGDFNVFWGDPEIELFLAATNLKSANISHAATYPSWSPKMELDLILHSPGIVIRDFQMPSVTFSDHLPLVCNFDIVK
jgi:endonuclease/exonuclease/phosphatase family metal-dependent hydrolase